MEVRAVDLILFAGQSNMAGRGEAEAAPLCSAQAGLEYRAVTRPDKLVPIIEPFGKDENLAGGIDDGERKKGGPVSAFVNRYHELGGPCVVAVSASEGGTATASWLERLVRDGANRLACARRYLSEEGIQIRHCYVVWCQGETDADYGLTAEQYKHNLQLIWRQFKQAGAEHCFLVAIGHFNHIAFPEGKEGLSGLALDERYRRIHDAQSELCAENQDFTLAADLSDYCKLMKDPYHYYQAAYNQMGFTAAETVMDFGAGK